MLIKGQAQHLLDLKICQQIKLFTQAGQPHRGCITLKKLSRQRLKGNDANPDIKLKSLLPERLKNGSVAHMHAIKITDGGHAPLMLRPDIVQPADQLHGEAETP